MEFKYICVEIGNEEEIFLFPKIVDHSAFASFFKPNSIISSGFAGLGVVDSLSGKVVSGSCFGKSTSLRLDSRKDDTDLLEMAMEKNLKYISCDRNYSDQLFVLFNDNFIHSDIAEFFKQLSIDSAGFVSFLFNDFCEITLSCIGKSDSLNIYPEPGDTSILSRWANIK